MSASEGSVNGQVQKKQCVCMNVLVETDNFSSDEREVEGYSLASVIQFEGCNVAAAVTPYCPYCM